MAPVLPSDRYSSTMEPSASEGVKDANVIALYDDDELKALLDEAIAYKRPKDREGKSEVFLQLLSKAEADDKEPFVKIGTTTRSQRARGSSSVSERGAAGGSLQNISSATEADSHYTGARRKFRVRQGPDSSVSSRQREGGSLPCNVNTGWVGDPWLPEGVRRREATVSGSSIQGSAGATQARRQTLKHSSSNELPTTDRATRDIYPLRRHHSSTEQSENRKMNDEGRVHKSEYCRLQTDEVSSTSGPDFSVSDVGYVLNYSGQTRENFSHVSLITTDGKRRKTEDKSTAPTTAYILLQEGSDSESYSAPTGAYRATASVQLGIEPDHIQFTGEPSRLANGLGSVDLNWDDRSVQCLVGNNSVDRAQRRLGDSSSLRHIDVSSSPKICSIQKPVDKRPEENGTAAARSNPICKKNIKRKQNSDKNVAVTRSEDMPGHRSDLAEKDVNVILNFIESDGKPSKGLKKQLPKQKTKDNKKQPKQLKKASSLEELSQRNIDDLTENTDDRKSRVEVEQRRSWGDKIFDSTQVHSELPISNPTFIQTEFEEEASDSEFQMVTKKTRRRRGVEAVAKRVRNRRSGRRSPRRKSTSSVPPSERSADSDLDSVHSLPAAAVGGRASDSDCDNSSAPPPLPTFLPYPSVPVHDASVLTTEDFPSLPVKPEPKPEPKFDVAKPKTRSKSVGPNTRPPVILLDERRQQHSAVCEFTFGFEVNQQLLQSSSSLRLETNQKLPSSPNEAVIKKVGAALPKSAWKAVEMPPPRDAAQQQSSRNARIADTLSFTSPNLTNVPPTSVDLQDLRMLKTVQPNSAKINDTPCWKPPISSMCSDTEAVAISVRTAHEREVPNQVRCLTSSETCSTSCPNECHLVVVVMPPVQDLSSEPVSVSETGTMTEELVDSAQEDQDRDSPEPQALHDRLLIDFLSRRYEEALASPDTVIYKE